MKAKAYAKLNLYLDIVRVREDGYHELDMIMQEVQLADLLTISPAAELTVDCPSVPMEKNLAYRAAQAFFAATKIAGGARIAIEKHIPSQAGMGGGSSDAACVLKSLNALYGEPLTMEELMALALPLGADVPFALLGGTARARGIGEQLTPLKNRLAAHYLIVKPPVGVPTGQAFHLADTRPKEQLRGNISLCQKALLENDFARFAEHTFNALTAPAIALCPEIRETLAKISACNGCESVFMTGSGSACVGLFSERAAAESACAALQSQLTGYFFAVTENV